MLKMETTDWLVARDRLETHFLAFAFMHVVFLLDLTPSPLRIYVRHLVPHLFIVVVHAYQLTVVHPIPSMCVMCSGGCCLSPGAAADRKSRGQESRERAGHER